GGWPPSGAPPAGAPPTGAPPGGAPLTGGPPDALDPSTAGVDPANPTGPPTIAAGLGGAPTGGPPVSGAPPGGAPVGGAPAGGAPDGGQPPAGSGAPPTNFVGGPPLINPLHHGGQPAGATPGGGPPVGGHAAGVAGTADGGGGGRGRYLLVGALLGLLVLAGGVGAVVLAMGDNRPAAVTALVVTEGDEQLTIDFDAPDNGPVDGYEVSINGGAWEPLPDSRQLTGLDNGTSYSVQVRAINDDGAGDASATSTEVTPYGRPAPASVTGSATGSTLRWSWSLPDGNGRPVSGYWVQFDDGDQVFQTEADFTSSGQLAPLSEHRLTVWTVNEGDDDDRNTSEPVTVTARTDGSATAVLLQTVTSRGDNGVELIRDPQSVEHLLDQPFAWRVSCQFLGEEYVSIYWQIQTRLVGDEIVVDITERLRYVAVNGDDLFADMCERDEEVTLIDQHTETHRFPIADGSYDLDPIELSGAGAVNSTTDRTLTITLTP
ncbi:MAG: fibronectin type III domain-containing protein, partial [Actinomycetota bacterium]